MVTTKHAYCVSLAAGLALAAATPSSAAAGPALSVSGGRQTTVGYACDDGTSLIAVYVNSPPDSLAIVPIDGRKRIFVNVLSGSGARYASGVYIWWSKGKDASLYDLRDGPDASAVSICHEKD